MKDLFDPSSISRRNFISTVGYALAVSPVTAFAIETKSDSIIAENIMIDTGKEKMPAFIARPKKSSKKLPCVIVIQEIFGIHAYIKDVCKRFALEGYVAVAPSLYFRQGDATKEPDIKKLISDIVSKVPQQQVFGDLDATTAMLKKMKETDGNKIFVTGFCWGGNATWMYSWHNPKIKAAAAWYGKVSGDVTPLQPKFPLDIAGELKVPVLGLYGAKDQGIPVEQVEKMREALKKGHSKSQIEIYPLAEHGFHADYRPSYHEASAKDAWSKVLAWFKSHA